MAEEFLSGFCDLSVTLSQKQKRKLSIITETFLLTQKIFYMYACVTKLISGVYVSLCNLHDSCFVYLCCFELKSCPSRSDICHLKWKIILDMS